MAQMRWVVGFVALLAACAETGGGRMSSAVRAGAPTPRRATVPSGAVSGGAPLGAGMGGTAATLGSDPNKAPAGCGNGMRTPDEACDDGNRSDGDGCSADCLGVELGFSCQRPGEPCRPIARCGDGVLALSEGCDDRNIEEGDGCSEGCRVELGFKCEGEPSACSATTCGDGAKEGSEGCDDGNDMPFDGCSASCQAEPDCAGGACSSACGDGLVLGEECDDGNRRSGDGCSADCTIEDGFTCAMAAACETRDGGCILRVPVVFRDFADSHPDFAVGCGELVPGLAESMLSPAGKPQLSGRGGTACIQSPESFSQWYTEDTGNAAFASELALYDNGRGGFVNRYGPNGEQWTAPQTYSDVVYGGPGSTGCEMCTPTGAQECFDPCTPWGNDQACCGEANRAEYDGNPLFFPLDDAPDALPGGRYRAKIPAEYGYDGWPWEDSIFPAAGEHNFHFTTEVVHWFKYDADTSALLEFTGDDDVWVFLNGRLAVDLGGPHVPLDGMVSVDAGTAGRFGLSPGNVYEIRIFHAERKVDGSTFRLTLSGFDTSPSQCTPVCGDGIVTIGEECDDGDNDGGYEECQPGCVLGERCGDGVTQAEEDCDDGNRRDGDGCGSSCRILRLL